MALHNEVGKQGEKLAERYLIQQNYTIIARNWRYKRAELDLIVHSPEGELVFVEVKTRSTTAFGLPGAQISLQKIALLADAANAFMLQIDHQWTYRFDFIGVVLPPNNEPIIRHYPDAFFP